MRRYVNGRAITRWLASLAVGASLLGALAGCRESVTLAFYEGLENLAVAVVQAFFDAITPTSSSTAGALDLMHSALPWLA